jgi:hypothetical protein
MKRCREEGLLVTTLVVDGDGMQEVLVQVVDEFKDVGVHRTGYADVVDERKVDLRDG